MLQNVLPQQLRRHDNVDVLVAHGIVIFVRDELRKLLRSGQLRAEVVNVLVDEAEAPRAVVLDSLLRELPVRGIDLNILRLVHALQLLHEQAVEQQIVKIEQIQLGFVFAEGLDLIRHGRDLVKHEAALTCQIPCDVLRPLEQRDVVAKAAAPEHNAVIVTREDPAQLEAQLLLPEEGHEADLIQIVCLDIGIQFPAKSAKTVLFIDIDELGEFLTHSNSLIAATASVPSPQACSPPWSNTSSRRSARRCKHRKRPVLF